MTTASAVDRELVKVTFGLSNGTVSRSQLADWLAIHTRRLVSSADMRDRGIVGDLYAALDESEQAHEDRPIQEVATEILKALGFIKFSVTSSESSRAPATYGRARERRPEPSSSWHNDRLVTFVSLTG